MRTGSAGRRGGGGAERPAGRALGCRVRAGFPEDDVPADRAAGAPERDRGVVRVAMVLNLASRPAGTALSGSVSPVRRLCAGILVTVSVGAPSVTPVHTDTRGLLP
ncbi:hypothetical protein CPE01_25540 [Cellulomonas persica]|uniref:Uncharacterized protein n=1 Tax=Cellulomonas persica TaxID=76861 RepID=A0A510UZ57_9CELL|nr:hypothetical protein CPE01_25540 [Cellulomonas persica]